MKRERHPKRHEFEINTRQTRPLPNASHGGFQLWTARRGDAIVYREYYDEATEDFRSRFAVVLGRVESFHEKWILVAAFNTDLCHAYERWVKPEWVETCRRDAVDLVPAWAADAEFWKLPPAMVVRLLDWGTVDRNAFRHWRETRDLLQNRLDISEMYHEAEDEGAKVKQAIDDGYASLPEYHARRAASAYLRMKALEEKKTEIESAWSATIRTEIKDFERYHK